MRPTTTRRLVILTEGLFGDNHAKTAYGVIRFGRDEVIAVLDSTQAGRDVDEALWGAAEWSVRAQLAYLAER